MSRLKKIVEWVLEPCDVNDDIIDPCHYTTRDLARGDASAMFMRYPDAVYVDLAKRSEWWDETDNLEDDQYEYHMRYYPDGRTQVLDRSSTPRW